MVLVYSGLKNDENGGMTHFGQMVKDGWVSGLIPDTEDCTGWDSGQMQNLYDKICHEWGKYANLPSLLPEDLKKRHERFTRTRSSMQGQMDGILSWGGRLAGLSSGLKLDDASPCRRSVFRR